jgi:hypothetical protein
LTQGLFDAVALDAMVAAERAVREAVDAIPPDVAARLTGTGKLTPADRDCLLELARNALASRVPAEHASGSPAADGVAQADTAPQEPS